jgi:radical SAM protein with 4Fe4S-binding SPASM domain
LNCLICSSEAGLPYEKELATIEIKDLLKQAKKLGAKSICFSGGEPFAHPNILDLCTFSKSLGLEIHIYTSGNVAWNNLLSPISEDLLSSIKPFVDKIIFGLQGPNAKIHESITRVSGSFDNAVVSIKRAICESIAVEIHFVPVKINYNYVLKMIDLSRELGVSKISFLRFVPQGRGKTYKSLLDLDKPEVLSLSSDLESVIDSKFPIVRIGAPFGILGLTKARCTAGENRATVRADGQVFPCEALKQLPGTLNNVRMQSLEEIWVNSPLFRMSRALAVTRNEQCLQCTRLKAEQCNGGCPGQSVTSRNVPSTNLDPCCFENEVAILNVKS